jgi:hypothetical protein
MSDLKWVKVGADHWKCQVPPAARFTLNAIIKGDGRWTWEVFAGAAERPMASGIVTSLGGAKHAAGMFLTKAGYT